MRAGLQALSVLLLASLVASALPSGAGAAAPTLSVPPSLRSWAHDQAAARVPHIPALADLAAAAKPSHAPARSVSPFVIGGAPVPPATAPASLVRITGVAEEFGFCSGTAVSPFLILTAAHCVAAAPGPVNVVAGTQVLGGNGGARYATTGALVDPLWDGDNLDHDVAVVTLAKPFRGPLATLAAADRVVAPGDALELYGWGQTATGASPLRLQHATLHAIGNAQCATLNGSLGTVTATMLCTHDPGAGGCHGDSGGPLFAGTGPAPVQVGIVSWGDPDCSTDFASVFARVSALHGFLDPLLGLVPAQVDLKAPWVDFGLLAVASPPTGYSDVCAFTLSGGLALCLGGTPAQVRGRSVALLAPPVGKAGFAVQAIDGDSGDPVSTTVAGTLTLKAGMPAVAPADPKPTIAVLKVGPDATYVATDVASPDGSCRVTAVVKIVACDDGGLLPLAYPYVGSFAPIEGIDAVGLALVGSDLVPVTGTASSATVFKVGAATALAPKLLLDPGFSILALKPGKGLVLSTTVWGAGASDPFASCAYIPSLLPMTACEGDAGGLLGSKVLLSSAMGPVDVEALQFATLEEGAATSSAIAENVPLAEGGTTSVALVFGAPPKAA